MTQRLKQHALLGPIKAAGLRRSVQQRMQRHQLLAVQAQAAAAAAAAAELPRAQSRQPRSSRAVVSCTKLWPAAWKMRRNTSGGTVMPMLEM
jgi:hypothetical protein